MIVVMRRWVFLCGGGCCDEVGVVMMNLRRHLCDNHNTDQRWGTKESYNIANFREYNVRQEDDGIY